MFQLWIGKIISEFWRQNTLCKRALRPFPDQLNLKSNNFSKNHDFQIFDIMRCNVAAEVLVLGLNANTSNSQAKSGFFRIDISVSILKKAYHKNRWHGMWKGKHVLKRRMLVHTYRMSNLVKQYFFSLVKWHLYYE